MLARVPLLNSQFQEVGFPVDWSVKLTVKGAHPDVALAVKFAVGFWPNEYIVPKTMKTNVISVFDRVVLFRFARR
jgi:hypothetical protein